jgi:hypothetical protein
MISVVNKKNGEVGIYIGRGSILGNRFVIGKDGNRDEVVEKYRQWLWVEVQNRSSVFEELVRLKRLSLAADLKLQCFCSPLKCHGHVVKSCIEWMTSAEIE